MKAQYLALLLAIPTIGYTANFTVPPNVTTTQTLADDGDVGTIEAGGTIIVSDVNGVVMAADNQTVTNAGTIEVSSAVVGKIAITTGFGNDNAVVTNSGTISTSGTVVWGIINGNNSNATLTNSGTITTTGFGSDGIYNNIGSNAVITNSGSITTTGSSAYAIRNEQQSGVQITNSGTVSTTGANSDAIYNNSSDSHQFVNTGKISTTNTNSDGVRNLGGASYNITNSGTISVTGSTSDAIASTGANTKITNSGTIKSSQSFALNLSGTNPTLTLLFGSNIQGEIQVSTDPLNLNVQEGLNLRLTIDDSSNGFGTLGIDSPYITVGNTETIAVVDRTGLSLQADVLEDLSDGILDGVFRRRIPYLYCYFPCQGAWAEGIGSYRKRQKRIHYQNWEGGFLAGYDKAFCCTHSLGFFGGTTYGEAHIAEGTQDAKISSYFAGLTYEQWFCNAFWGFSLVTGYVGWDNKRIVMNNLAPTGEERARAHADGWLFSPELTYSKWLHSGTHFRPVGSLSFKYAGLFLGSYDESGSGSDLFVKNRHVDLLKLTGDVALSFITQTKNACWNVAPYIGVAGRFQVGGVNVNAKLLDQPLSFSTKNPTSLAELLLGIRGEETIGRVTLFFDVQGLFDTDQSSRILGEFGAGCNF